MQRSSRAPLIASVIAHGAFFALCGRVRERSIAVIDVDSAAIELDWIYVHAQRARPPSEPEAAPIELRAPRLARVVRDAPRSTTAPVGAVIAPTAPSPTSGAEVTPQPANPASVSGMNLLRSMSRDAFSNERWRFGPAPVEGPVSAEQLAEQRALDRNVGVITDRWREDALRAAPPPRPPGSSEYVRRVATAAARAWAPVRAQDPSIAEGVLRLLLGGVEGYRAAQTDHLGMNASGRAAAAGDSLDHAHPHSPMLQSNPTLNEVGRATAQRIAVEIDARQTPDGRIVALSVARSSGSGFFDRQAIDAVRRAIEQSGARSNTDSSVPTRTRWEFELRVARNPPMALGPQLPGAPTVFNAASGGVEWGGVDPPRPMYPFALHRYQRVRILWVTRDATAVTATASRPDAGR